MRVRSERQREMLELWQEARKRWALNEVSEYKSQEASFWAHC